MFRNVISGSHLHLIFHQAQDLVSYFLVLVKHAIKKLKFIFLCSYVTVLLSEFSWMIRSELLAIQINFCHVLWAYMSTRGCILLFFWHKTEVCLLYFQFHELAVLTIRKQVLQNSQIWMLRDYHIKSNSLYKATFRMMSWQWML